MFDKYQKKFTNVRIFLDLAVLMKRMPKDFSHVRKVQDRRIQKLMRKAYKIPFYKKRFDEAGVKPSDIRTAADLNKLPLLTKDEVRAWMSEIEDDPKYTHWYHDTTSGSSGKPLMVLFSPREKGFMMADWFRVMLIAGYNPFRGKTMSRMSAHSVSAGYDTALQRIGILRRDFLNQYAPEEDMIKQVNDYKPDFLYMNKTEMMRLCLYCNDHDSKIWQPQFFVPTGEMSDNNARKLFMKVLGPNMIDEYGTAETGSVMVRYVGSDEYVVNTDLFVVNVVDDDGKPSLDGNIVVTPLYKTEIPLINYYIGDKVTSEIRDGVRFVTSVKGRSNDFFRYDTGEVTTFFEIAPIIAHFSDILQIRFIQESYDEITVQCVHDKQESNMTTDEIEEKLTAQLNAKFKHPFKISYNWMDSIPPDENGKLRMIVCKVK